jgi:hypothetical protein
MEGSPASSGRAGAPGAFSFSRAVREWAFVQLPLLKLDDFRNAAQARGLSGLNLLDAKPWETLDREDLLVPVAYSRHAMWHYDQTGCLEDGDLKIREEVGFIARDDLTAEAEGIHGKDAWPQAWYHYWQVLHLAALEHQLTPQVPWGNLLEGFEGFLDARARTAPTDTDKYREGLRGLAAGWRTTELLLLRVQNMFFPFERGAPRETAWTGSQIPGLTHDAAEWSRRQLEDSDYQALAEDCGTDAEDLAVRYEQLVRAGMWMDPTKQLIDLLDQIRRPRREQLTGAARLALDYYDAARILRHWHTRLTGSELPDVDEHAGLNGTEFKLRRFGRVDVRGRRDLLPLLLEEYGLYPWRVQLICEGDSELVALRYILEEGHGLSFEWLGISVVDMGGSDIPKNGEKLLNALFASLRGYANYFLLVFDNEGRTEELITNLLRTETIEGLSQEQRSTILERAKEAIPQITDPRARKTALKAALERAEKEALTADPGMAPEFVLWKENLEADSFTAEELATVINTVASDEFKLDGFELTGTEIQDATDRDDEGRGVASVALGLACTHDAGFVLSKPDFAARLARYALEHPENPRGSGQRPLLELAGHLIQLTWADRRLRNQLRK